MCRCCRSHRSRNPSSNLSPLVVPHRCRLYSLPGYESWYLGDLGDCLQIFNGYIPLYAASDTPGHALRASRKAADWLKPRQRGWKSNFTCYQISLLSELILLILAPTFSDALFLLHSICPAPEYLYKEIWNRLPLGWHKFSHPREAWSPKNCFIAMTRLKPICKGLW